MYNGLSTHKYLSDHYSVYSRRSLTLYVLLFQRFVTVSLGNALIFILIESFHKSCSMRNYGVTNSMLSGQAELSRE